GRGLGAHALAVGDLALVARRRLLEIGAQPLDLAVGLARIELQPEVDEHLVLGALRAIAARHAAGTAPRDAHRTAATEHARVRARASRAGHPGRAPERHPRRAARGATSGPW